jgi:ribonuclease-3
VDNDIKRGALKSSELLEARIGYTFNNKQLLKEALTHSSYINEIKHKSKTLHDNERLEFLGDSILSLITSEFLFSEHRDYDEGVLTRTRAAIVCENSLFEFASEIDLGDYILFGHGETVTHGRARKSILADAFEALLAAIYLDGGIEYVKSFLLPRIAEAAKKTIITGTQDYKSQLQRIVQQTPEELLHYVLEDESGPPHDKRFTFAVFLNSNFLGCGTGRSKREAEQNAAREALIAIGELN